MKDRTTAVLSAGFLALAGAGAGLLVWPAYAGMRGHSREIARLRTELAKPTSDPEVIAALASELESLRALGEARMTPIPLDADIAGLMEDLSGALEGLGIDRREITTGSTKLFDEASSLPVSVSLQGEFLKVYGLVRHLEELPRLVRVERLRVSTGQGGAVTAGAGGDLRAEINLEVFFAPRDVRSLASAERGGG